MPTHKPEAVKQAVVSKRLQGDSKRKIARELQINRETVNNILDESQVEPALAQWRRDYLQLVPAALNVVKTVLLQHEDTKVVDKDMLGTALQVLKGTGVHEERSRSRNDVRIANDYTNESDEQITDSIQKLLAGPQPKTTP
jgi:hypothetical protein